MSLDIAAAQNQYASCAESHPDSELAQDSTEAERESAGSRSKTPLVGVRSEFDCECGRDRESAEPIESKVSDLACTCIDGARAGVCCANAARCPLSALRSRTIAFSSWTSRSSCSLLACRMKGNERLRLGYSGTRGSGAAPLVALVDRESSEDANDVDCTDTGRA